MNSKIPILKAKLVDHFFPLLNPYQLRCIRKVKTYAYVLLQHCIKFQLIFFPNLHVHHMQQWGDTSATLTCDMSDDN